MIANMFHRTFKLKGQLESVIHDLENDTILEIASGVAQINSGIQKIMEDIELLSMGFRLFVCRILQFQVNRNPRTRRPWPNGCNQHLWWNTRCFSIGIIIFQIPVDGYYETKISRNGLLVKREASCGCMDSLEPESRSLLLIPCGLSRSGPCAAAISFANGMTRRKEQQVQSFGQSSISLLRSSPAIFKRFRLCNTLSISYLSHYPYYGSGLLRTICRTLGHESTLS